MSTLVSVHEAEAFSAGLRARLVAVEEPGASAMSEGAEQVLLSPELVLVCPELRELALRLLPDRDPDGFLSIRPREQPPEDTGTAVVDTTRDASEPDAPSDPPLAVSLLAYTAQQSLNMALHGVGVIAATIGIVLLLAQFHR